jgi:hypothetical protein
MTKKKKKRINLNLRIGSKSYTCIVGGKKISQKFLGNPVNFPPWVLGKGSCSQLTPHIFEYFSPRLVSKSRHSRDQAMF